ncbi:hypothetical protein HPB48_009262 [Haemaphysalis longicornis]|uniref:SEC7 domain-containing protein n=1 Tax=Haemaphysalis longicornis TaxID=44386 RepID=A0A9J6GEP3_HAELO|nr:hypothetical protein HPB48_009262 [Haemaphysalis longicornis]
MAGEPVRQPVGYASIYGMPKEPGFSYRRLYLQLDEGTITFNADAELGMQYFISQRLVKDIPIEIARFLHNTKRLFECLRCLFGPLRQVLDHLVELQNFENQLLPEALRRFFRSLQAPNTQNSYLRALLEKFSLRFCKCNPHLGLSSDMVYILCFSLIMLSVDLSSPHIKNKMSKREFIRNVRQAIHRADDELYGHLYDDIYLRGHVAPNSED